MSTIKPVENTVVVNPVTASDIAAKLGMNIHTVHCYLRPECNVKSAAAKRVMETAKAMGYVSKRARQKSAANANAIRCQLPANRIFATREAETKAMINLRNHGYGDVEIAAKCGVCSATVIARIGRQPASITNAHRQLAGKIRAAKNQMRRNLASEQRIREYNDKVAAFNAEAVKLIEQYKQLRQMKITIGKISGNTSVTPIHKLN